MFTAGHCIHLPGQAAATESQPAGRGDLGGKADFDMQWGFLKSEFEPCGSQTQTTELLHIAW